MKLSDLGEFGFIGRIARSFGRGLPAGVLGIGDDCAVLPWSKRERLLVTTDMLLEGTHFLRDGISPGDLGWKSLAVNLSDIAAMGGCPRWGFLSLGLPGDLEVPWLDAFFRGWRSAARMGGLRLLGGDTTRSPGSIVINVAVLGTIAAGRVKRRSAARPGDVIAVTGCLGDSAGGLRVLLEDRPHGRDESRLLRAHNRPRPHLAEGMWLAGRPGVRAMMDVSDGIDSDLRRIMDRSRVGVEVDLSGLPVSPSVKRTSARYGWDVEALAAAGGEDYCLLATIASSRFPSVAAAFARRFGHPLRRIGRVGPRSWGLGYLRQGGKAELAARGFDHFSGLRP